MNEGWEKALRRARKVRNFLRHCAPGNEADADEIRDWARAGDAMCTVERYLERCKKRRQCNTH